MSDSDNGTNSTNSGRIRSLLDYKHNPIAIVCACILMVLGALLGQMLGLQFVPSYSIFFSLLGSSATGLLGYLVTFRLNPTKQNFFTATAIALSLMFGGIWGTMTIGPILFFYVTGVLGANLSIGIGLVIGAFVMSIVGVIASKIHHRVSVNFINILSFGLTGMTLFGCLGLALNPVAWALSLTAGAFLGMLSGIINSILTPANDSSKILASFFSISGAFIGVMLGAMISSVIPILPSALISSFFGFSLMLGGVLMGNLLGKNFSEFDLEDDKLMHKIYLSVMPLPIMFNGYLSGGSLGYKVIPQVSIILSQAAGLITATSLYGSIVAVYYIIRDYCQKGSKNSTLKGLDPRQADNVEAAIGQAPEAVRDMLLQMAPTVLSSSALRLDSGAQQDKKISLSSLPLTPRSEVSTSSLSSR